MPVVTGADGNAVRAVDADAALLRGVIAQGAPVCQPELGALVLNGHRTGGPALLRHIERARVGGLVTLSGSDGSVCSFRIDEVGTPTEAGTGDLIRDLIRVPGAVLVYSCADGSGGAGGTSHRRVLVGHLMS